MLFLCMTPSNVFRLRAIETKSIDMKQPDTGNGTATPNPEEVSVEKKRANEAIHRIQAAARQLNQ